MAREPGAPPPRVSASSFELGPAPAALVVTPTRGVRGTPSFFINGKPYVGPRTVEGFARAIDAELARVNASGVPVAEVYSRLMETARPRL